MTVLLLTDKALIYVIKCYNFTNSKYL